VASWLHYNINHIKKGQRNAGDGIKGSFKKSFKASHHPGSLGKLGELLLAGNGF